MVQRLNTQTFGVHTFPFIEGQSKLRLTGGKDPKFFLKITHNIFGSVVTLYYLYRTIKT